MSADLCILIPTFERYRPIAEFTRAKIAEYWPAHPPVFFCGLAPRAAEEYCLQLRDDPADWMALVRSACGDLQARGFARCYLILDDHPPLEPCHARHLNETLPALLDRLRAAYINLHGWGQHKPRQGHRLGARDFYLEQPGHDYLWKFALHPGLWNLAALTELLDLLLATPEQSERTCWKFERRAGALQLPAHLRAASYRICGTKMTARRGAWLFARWRAVELFAFDVLRFLIRIGAGQRARARFDAARVGAYHFYDGPYPLFWSGLMKKGRLNPDLVFFLRLHRRHGFLAEVERAVAGLTAAPAASPSIT